MNEAQGLWSQVCQHLSGILQPDVYSRWIAVIEPISLNGDTLTLGVDNDFYQSWLEEHYLPLIRKALATITESNLTILFDVKQQAVSEPVRQQPEEPEAPTQSRSDKAPRRNRMEPTSTLNPKFTFEKFIIGSSNSFAHAATIAVAQAPARAYNPLFIYGDVGLGKTHLMQAIGHHVVKTSHATVCYLSCEAFVNEYIDALQNRNLLQFRKKFRNTDLLLIDDIHFLGSKERMQEEFFHTFNTLFDSHKQIVMTSDRPASEIPGLEQRLVSRFEWGLVTELEPPDLETRIAILRHKQEQANLRLDDNILLFIAENVRSNIRRLEGALVRTLSYAGLTGRPLTMDIVRHILRDTLDQEKQEELSFASIQKMVAEHYDVRLADMASKRRPRLISGPRQVAMFLCRKLTRSSLPEIAGAFGKTHATVLHACKSVDSRLEIDATLRQDIQTISQKLGRPVV